MYYFEVKLISNLLHMSVWLIWLLGDSKQIALISIAVIFIGIIISFLVIYKVQKKYNGGIF